MLIKVKTLTGREIEMNVEGTFLIQQVKEKLEELEGIPPPQQRLIFNGRQMLDDKSLDELDIKQGCTLHLVLSL